MTDGSDQATSLSDFALPTAADADYLLAGLAQLVKLRGVGPLVATPLLLPEPRFFPDGKKPRAEGAALILRRLMAYAGLAPERVDVSIDDPSALPADDGDPAPGPHVAAWFLDVSQGVYRFGINEESLRHEEGLVGTLGHEVAHAYRAHHQLVVRNRDAEEQLTDLTTVYLGFGVFTLESSFMFRTEHRDGALRFLYEKTRQGYLSPGYLAFLLGAQLVVRDFGAEELDEVARALSPNQEAAVRAAVAELGRDREALLGQLGLPDEGEWPDEVSLDEALVPLPPCRMTLADKAKAGRDRENEGRIAFRTKANHRLLGAMVAGAAALVALVLRAEMDAAFFYTLFAAVMIGYFVGARIPGAKCSGCGHAVGVKSVKCPFCDVKLVGDIAHVLDRFEAEDRWREREASASR